MPQGAPGASGSRPIISRSGEIAWVRAEPGDVTPIIDFVKGQLPGWFGGGIRLTGINKPRVSVGKGVVPVVPASTGIPKLPGQQISSTTVLSTALPGPIDRRDETPIQSVVQTNMTLADFLGTGLLTNEQWERATRGVAGSPGEIAELKARSRGTVMQRPDPIPTPIKITPPIIPTTTKTQGTKPMDLGSLITDLGTTYIKTKYAQTATPAVQAQPAYSVFDAGSDIIDYFSDPATGAVVPVRKKKVCRRRRKRLATKSDLGDLAALKAILGNGEAFKAWIATHSR